MRAAWLILFLLSPAARADAPAYLDELQQAARAKELSQDRYWRLLVHYRRGRLGRLRSEAAGPDFFLSPRGRRDPRAELEATLAGFFDPDPPEADKDAMHPQCRFPARYAWLKERLAFDSARLPEKGCPRFQEWRAKVDPESVTLVFASSYLNSPASMYGHTFLRFDKRGHGRGERLLDQTLNFSAMVADPNPVEYVVRGLSGGFAGRFSAMPYYLKVQEYSHLESRDLWEFRLALGPAALERMVAHAWELGSTHFPYYFLNKNCSYQLLPLLEVAEPRLELTPGQALWVIPADTVRWAARHPDLIGEPVFRPSQSTKMRQRRAFLDAPGCALARELAEGSTEQALARAAGLPAEARALALDTASELLLYRSGPQKDPEAPLSPRERRLLAARGALDEPPRELPRPEWAAPPTEGHRTLRAGLGAGSTGEGPFQELTLRFALHDTLDPPRGYAPHSALEMAGPIRARRDSRSGALWLHELPLLRVASLAPWDPWIREPSWSVELGLATAEELRPDYRHAQHFRFRGGPGLAAPVELGGEGLLYALASADAGAGQVFDGDYRLGAGGAAGLWLAPFSRWRLRLEGEAFGYAAGDRRPNLGVRLDQQLDLARDAGLRLGAGLRGKRRELLLSLFLYL